MIPAGELTGAVMAGGHSRRMGRDKAMLAHKGTAMWTRQVGILREVGADPVAVVRAPGQPPLGLPDNVLLWHDLVTDAGPLAGLHVALSHCRTNLLAVVAVDMPNIDAWWFQWLGNHSGSTVGAMACHPDGRYEPLAAIYSRLALQEIAARLTSPDLSLQSLAHALLKRQLMRSVPLSHDELWRVKNWNIPADTAASAEGPASAG